MTIPCFSNWQSLSDAVAVSASLGQGSVFSLCRDVVLEAVAFSPIDISASNTVIRCGEAGSRADRCVVNGGTTHFRVVGNPQGVEFRGIFFQGASSTTIHVSAGTSSSVLVEGCVFTVSIA